MATQECIQRKTDMIQQMTLGFILKSPERGSESIRIFDPPRTFVFVYVFVFVFVFVFLFLFDRVHYSMRDLLATPLAPLYANC